MPVQSPAEFEKCANHKIMHINNKQPLDKQAVVGYNISVKRLCDKRLPKC